MVAVWGVAGRPTGHRRGGVSQHVMVEAQAKVRFDAAVETTRVSLERRMDRYIDVLRATRALFSASEVVTRAEFRTYISNLQLAEKEHRVTPSAPLNRGNPHCSLI